jgi:hypothetical protein
MHKPPQIQSGPWHWVALRDIPYVFNRGEFQHRTAVSAAVNKLGEGDRVMDSFIKGES